MSPISKILALVLLFSGCNSVQRPAAPVAERGARDWVVDPGIPGPDEPPSGRSLFDSLVRQPIPFPFARLLQQIEEGLGGGVSYRRVLIPLGRSLQRAAAEPDFFNYPRAVVAFDAEPPRPCGMPVKDRLFMGYQEKAGVIEVLSYNETAGRFEFQLVSDYREGAIPVVTNASRKVCTVCHQNQAPLFPRQLWDETNSNPRVLRFLLRERRDYYGFPVEQSADVPYQIDNAIHRANELSLYQLLWTQMDARVRAAWLRAMLACRLSGGCEFDRKELIAPIPTWQAAWPRGLRIPNPEIPNRNPLAILSRESPPTDAETLTLLANRQKSIEPWFEPAAVRDPLEIVPVDTDLIQRVIAGMAALFAASDIAAVDRALRQRTAAVVRHRATCAAQPGAEWRCEGGFSMNASLSPWEGKLSGWIHKLTLPGEAPVRDLRVRNGNVSARSGAGNRIERIEAEGRDAVLVVRLDFRPVEQAIAQWADAPDAAKFDVLGSKPFRPSLVREALNDALGIAAGSGCLAQ